MATQELGAGVEAYKPKYALWSDGADKRRWFRLPPGTTIDTADMDYWKFPPGTKIWKEFSKDGKVLETRYMAKYGADGMDWVYVAYQWNPDGSDAVAAPNGAENVAGTTHDIPSDLTCLKCHEGLDDGALGIGALQLSHDGDGLRLTTLIERGLLSAPPAGPLVLPGDEATQEALGYLHANCGTCHNPRGGEAFSKNAAIVYLQSTKQLDTIEQTTTYQEMVTRTNGNLSLLLKGVERMMSRPEKQMPPVASEFVDDQGVALVDAWNKQLLKKFPQAKFADAGTDAGEKPRDAGR
jgi:mono/diheme cytochrome c family protein